MNDRAAGLLEKYEIEVLHTRKGRGAILCDTDKGCLIFKEYAGNEERISMQNRLLEHINGMSSVQAETIIPTKEGTLLVRDNDSVQYILKTYKEGRECNIYDKSECMEAVRLLAKLHQCMELSVEEQKDIIFFPFSQQKEYEKHNKELKKVRKYLQQRGQKTWFEIRLQNTFDYFLEQALQVTCEWSQYADACQVDERQGPRIFCHGDYQYHNLLKSEGSWYIVNFEKCLPDSPMRDLYLLMRKLLEKSNWSIPMGRELLEAYERERQISAIDRIDLYYRLFYPEKFWKIVNFYYNSGKAWIPERNREKLEKVIAQEKEKQLFLDAVFRNLDK